jgi:formate dehydrogenase gamma subunit
MFFIPLTDLLAAGEEIQKTALSQMQAPGRITSQEPDSVACAECHTAPIEKLPAVTEAHLANSVHAGLDCIDCHTAIKVPHQEELIRAECKECHADVAAIYRQHGRSKIEDSEDIPGCGDCHGSHDILPVNDPRSKVSSLNLPQTCAKCHEDQELITRLNIRFKLPIKVYSQSVHGRANAVESQTAATCNDCHSTGGTAHMILPPGDSRSTINYFNIPSTCGKCHGSIEQDFQEGIHGELLERGEVDAPSCTKCHGEHGILAATDPRSPVSLHRVAESTCSPCHSSGYLSDKYGLPTGRLVTFIESYHGLKSRAGDKKVATCVSCHGAHRILPASNPGSSISKKNLPETCGKCHTGISLEMATDPIHEGQRTGIARLVEIIYIWAIIIIIGLMVLHWLIDLIRQIVNVMREKQVRRMDPDEVIQHTILALSFTVLVITGFSLRFYNSWWSNMFFGFEGGSILRGMLHRIAGVMMILGTVWHSLFLFTARGRAFLRDMMPRLEDFRQFFQMMQYNLGGTDEEPQVGRFSYVEKAEYWALVWGTAVMCVTGLLLWFKNVAVAYFPMGLLDVCLVIHYYEAWLAFLAILIWHMYATIFNPRVYPMNPSWLTGKMPVRMFEEEAAKEREKGRKQVRVLRISW